VAYVADTPEELLVSCMCSNVSPVTTATRDQFGDAFRHPLRKGSSTIARIKVVMWSVSHADVSEFFKMCKKFNLNSVHEPFWQDWALSDPSIFITPEPLHHIHCMFWDHDLQWAISVVGARELDFRFMLLQVSTGYHGFKDGVSTLKQVSSRDHRDVQRYLIGLIAAASPSDFISAIRSLCEFCYLAQAPSFTEGAVKKLEHALKNFHAQKEAIVNAGARRGKSGEDKPWTIPKLELLQGVVPSIHSHGSLMQWSADPTERAHIDYVKVPGRAGNNHDYDEQVCRFLNRQEKCQNFALAMNIKLWKGLDIDEDEDDRDKGNVDKGGRVHRFVDYFERARQLAEGTYTGADVPQPLRTFAMSITAYHLNADPTLTRMTVDGVADVFELSDLRTALADYLECDAAASAHVIGGRRRALPNCRLPFEHIQVWCKVRMQLKSYHEQQLEPSQAVLAQPPSEAWPCGRYDAVIVNVDPTFKWPHSHLEGSILFCFVFIVDNSSRSLCRPATFDFPPRHPTGTLRDIPCLRAAFRYCYRGSGYPNAYCEACATLKWCSHRRCDTSEQDCISYPSHSSFRTIYRPQTCARN
jgi:hypothetical protein